MLRYENTISSIEATFKTNKKKLLPFLVSKHMYDIGLSDFIILSLHHQTGGDENT